MEEILHRHFPTPLGRVRRWRGYGAALSSLHTGWSKCRRSLLTLITLITLILVLMPDEGSVPLPAYFAKVTLRTEASLRRKTAVRVGNRESSGVRRVRHFARPIEGTERIPGNRPNVSRPARFLIGDVERDGRRGTGVSQVDYFSIRQSIRECKLVDDRHIRQRNRDGVVRDRHGVIGDLNDPEKTVCADPAVEVMHLCRWKPRTREPEIYSYLDEGATYLLREGGRSSCAERGLRTKVITLVDANVSDDLVLLAGVIRGRPERVAHGDCAVEIGDSVWLGVHAVEEGPRQRNARSELIDEWRHDVAARYGHRENLRRRLSPYRGAAEDGHGKTNCSLHGDALASVC